MNVVSTALRNGMGRRVAVCGMAGALALSPVVGPTAAFAGPMPESFAALVETVSPAVVQIAVKHDPAAMAAQQGQVPDIPEEFREGPFKDFFDRFFQDREGGASPHRPAPRQRTAVGSGFLIDAQGHVVTNNHVIRDASEIEVTLKDGRAFDAELLGADKKTDLAVLKLDTDEDLPFVSCGDSDATRVGDWVLAVGNPFGLGGTVTAGIVSARGWDIGSGPYDDYIQVDAPINRGNSGGPLFDGGGRVVGVNTAIFSPNGGNVGIGFAIPANLARDVVAQLRETGIVERGWLGVTIQPVTPDVAESLGLDHAKGALVASVTEDSPAEKAGLRQGDVILSYAGEVIATIRDLTRAVADTRHGAREDLQVWRGEQLVAMDVTIGEAPTEMAAVARQAEDGVELAGLGLTLAPLDEKTRDRFGLGEEADGVLITRVAVGSPAADKGLKPGDLIVSVNQETVAGPDTVEQAIAKATSRDRSSALFLIERGGERRFVALKLSTPDNNVG